MVNSIPTFFYLVDHHVNYMRVFLLKRKAYQEALKLWSQIHDFNRSDLHLMASLNPGASCKCAVLQLCVQTQCQCCHLCCVCGMII